MKRCHFQKRFAILLICFFVGAALCSSMVNADSGTTGPSAPGNLSLQQYNSTAADLSWDASTGDREIIEYRIYGGGHLLKSVPPSENEARITALVHDLTPTDTYHFYVLALDADGKLSPPSESVSCTVPDVAFKKGQRAEFTGISTHTEPVLEMDDALASLQNLVQSNPVIGSLTIKLQWEKFHPEKDVVYWDKLEQMIALADSKKWPVHIVFLPGFTTPEWVYAEGAVKAGPITSSGVSDYAPVPWDSKYMELFTADIREFARRYKDDPRIFAVEVSGHNYRSEEMHAPNASMMTPYGISRQVVLDNWKYWIDLFGMSFPDKKLILVLSQMYGGADYANLNADVMHYFVTKYQGRAILQHDQLHGREASRNPIEQLIGSVSAYAPHRHEMVGSFKEQPERQGTPEMTVYNFIRMGNPLNLQLWRRDADIERYAQTLSDLWNQYKDMTPDEIEARLKAEGKWIETSTWDSDKPTWWSPPYTYLQAEEIRPHSITLTWGVAADDDGVSDYAIYMDGHLLQGNYGGDYTVPGQVTEYTVTGLMPNRSYTFKIEAVDPNGKMSTTGPSAVFSHKKDKDER